MDRIGEYPMRQEVDTTDWKKGVTYETDGHREGTRKKSGT